MIQQEFDKAVYDEAIDVCELQKVLFNVTDDNIESSLIKILKTSRFLNEFDENEIDTFIHVIEDVIQYRPYNHNIVAKLCSMIISSINDEKVKSCLIDKIMMIPIDRYQSYENIPFLHKCFYHNIFTKDQIISLILKRSLLANDNNEAKFTFFCYFAPLLKQEFPQFYLECIDEIMKSNYGQYKHFISKLEFFQKMNWELHDICCYDCYIPNSIEWVIKQDDTRLLEGIIARPVFDANKFIFEKVLIDNQPFHPDMRITPSVFEPARILSNFPTLIQFAAFHDSKNIFTYLLKLGANTNLNDKGGLNLSQFIAASGHLDMIELYSKERFNFFGASHFATAYFHLPIVQWLIQYKNVDLQQNYEHFGSIVHRSAASNCIEILNFCFEKGCDVNIATKYGETPMHAAAAKGQIEAIKFMLGHRKILPNARDNDGCSPFYFAVLYNRKEAVKCMMNDKRININEPDDEAKMGYFEVVMVLLGSPIIDINVVNDCGQTPLHYASIFDQLETAKILLSDERINVNAQDCLHQTPIFVSVLQNNCSIIQELLKSPKIMPNICDVLGFALFHIAVEVHNVESMTVLLNASLNKLVDINSRDEIGLNAIQIAAKNGDMEMFNLLLPHSDLLNIDNRGVSFAF